MNKLLSLCITFLLVALLTSCGGGGGGGKKEDTHVDPTECTDNCPDTLFHLSGTLEGLASGKIRISNGVDTLLLELNGEFHFPTGMKAGTSYKVTIVEMPEGQICSVEGGINVITRDRDDVVVNCATLSEVTVEFSKPAKLQYDELRLLSNYEAKGGLGEEPIEGSPVTIKAFNNSYISLRDLNGNLIYLAFIDEVKKAEFTLDSYSTAVAFVLLEPSIALGLLDHNIKPVELIKKLELSTDKELNTLSGEIAKRVNKGDDVLLDTDDDLYVAYQLALLKAASFLNQAFAEDLTEDTTANAIPAGKFSLRRVDADADTDSDTDTESDDGIKENTKTVKAYAGLLSQPQPGVAVDVENLANRGIAIRSTIFNGGVTYTDNTIGGDHIKIRSPDETAKIIFTGELQDDFKMTLDIFGPGEFGEYSELPTTDTDIFIAAVTRSVLVQYLLPSLKTMLGLVDIKGFNIEACYKGETLDLVTQKLLTTFKTDTNLINALSHKQYYYAYTAISKEARKVLKDSLTTNTQTSLQPLVELLNCSEFVTGSFIDKHREFAFENTISLWDGINQLIDTENGDLSFVKTVDLFAQNNLMRMIRDLKTLRISQSWELEKSDLTPAVPNQATTVIDGVTTDVDIKRTSTVETGNNLQVRVFNSALANQEFPSFSVKLNNYNGDGTYSLNNIGNENCIGLAAISPTRQYCTQTGALYSDHPVTGEAVVSTVSATEKKVSSSFNAVEVTCKIPANCTPISVSGEFTFTE